MGREPEGAGQAEGTEKGNLTFVCCTDRERSVLNARELHLYDTGSSLDGTRVGTLEEAAFIARLEKKPRQFTFQ
jgi:hypothetical protein